MAKQYKSKLETCLLLGAVLFFSACVSGERISSLSPSVVQPVEGLGQLIVYRTSGFGFAITPTLSLDGQVLTNGENPAECINGGASLINLPAGNYEISMETEVKRSANVQVDGGKRTYVKCSISFGVIIGRPKFELIDSTVGETEVFKSDNLKLTGTYNMQ